MRRSDATTGHQVQLACIGDQIPSKDRTPNATEAKAPYT
jgi:hypothetical protein